MASNFDLEDLGVKFVVVCFEWSLSNYTTTYKEVTQNTMFENHQKWPTMTFNTLSGITNIFERSPNLISNFPTHLSIV